MTAYQKAGGRYLRQRAGDAEGVACACRPEGKRIIANVISGFLGAGKTSLVNYLLSQLGGARCDVLIREYGHVAVDDRLLGGVPKERVHVFSGFSLHDDPQLMLHDYLHRLASEDANREMGHLLIETSGLDAPQSMAQLFMIGYMPGLYEPGSFIVVADGKYGMRDLDEYEVAVEQVAFADVLVINKADLATTEELDALEKRLRGINGIARVTRTSFGIIDAEEALDTELYDQLRSLSQESEAEAMDEIKTFVLSDERPMDKDKVNRWIDGVFTEYGADILRGKGFLSFAGDEYRYEFQSVRESFHSYARDKWSEGEERKSVIVLIGGKALPEETLRRGFESCAEQ